MKKQLLFLLALTMGVFTANAQDPCTSITNITCGSSTTFTQSGTGNVNYPNNFGACTTNTSQGGKEQIYLFTPPTTGTYEFNVTTATGGVVQYLWKEASLGCNPNAWNCIERTNVTGSVGAENFTAGTTYYIMLNAEPTTSVTHVFNISCARIVCNNILPITCGTSTTFTNIGYGDPNYSNDFGGCTTNTFQGGKEQIYSFTPTQDGTYEFNLTTATGGVVQYLWKEASLGCNPNAWNCIDRVNTTGSVGAENFTAGITYYIMLNAEPVSSVTHVFNISCARIVCNNILPITCGTPTMFTNIGYGDPNYSNDIGGCTTNTFQGGKEQIYLVNSSTSYSINVSPATGTVQYLWKLASLGCNDTDWNCLERKNSPGAVANTNSIPTNVPIYLMLNAETTSAVTHVFTINCTLENQDFVTNAITVYPNPAKTVIHLQVNDNTLIDKVVIVDLTGKIIKQQTRNTTTINVEDLAKGLYIIEAYSSSQKTISKFVKD